MDLTIVRTDDGAVNSRIVNRQEKADFRRVEAASIKRTTRLNSPDGKRMFVRHFSTFQLAVHFIGTIARLRLKPEDVDLVVDHLRTIVDTHLQDTLSYIAAAEELCRRNGITELATYDTQSLEIEVGIISNLGNKYFELFHAVDRLMPLIQTQEIFEIIKGSEAEIQRAKFKRKIRSVTGNARNLAAGLRKRISVAADPGSSLADASVPDSASALTGDVLQDLQKEAAEVE